MQNIPAYRWHHARNAVFKAGPHGQLVAHYDRDVGAETEIARRLGVVDLCAMPRSGFKGAGAVEWLASQGLVVPAAHNKAARQSDGSLVLRCGENDVVIAGDLSVKLKAAHTRSNAQPRGYDALREESHAWFAVTGEEAPAMLAHVCEVDLGPRAFTNLEIVQTFVANLATIVVRNDTARIFTVHLFFDIASSVYFCETFSELLGTLGGGFIGHDCFG